MAPVNNLKKGLVGYWTFDGKDMLNGAVKDKSGNNNTGNLVNIATSTAFVIDANGKVGIGTTSPWQTLSVNGHVSLAGLTTSSANQTYDLCLDSNLQVIADTVAAGCISSSMRFKHDINTLTLSALDEVMALRPVSFYYNQADPNASSTEQLGFIAEEALKIDPRLVGIGSDGLPRTFKYENFTAILAKAIQELNMKVVELAKGANTTVQTVVTTVSDWVGNSIQAVVGTFERVVARMIETDRIKTNELCVDDTCLSKEQLRALIIQAGGTAAVPPAGAPSDGVATSSPPSSSTNYPLQTTDSSPPTITVIGNNPSEIDFGTPYLDLGATVEDNIDHNLGIHTTGDVIDTSISGTYSIIYTATDGAGNTATSTREVIVKPKPSQDPISATTTPPDGGGI